MVCETVYVLQCRLRTLSHCVSHALDVSVAAGSLILLIPIWSHIMLYDLVLSFSGPHFLPPPPPLSSLSLSHKFIGWHCLG